MPPPRQIIEGRTYFVTRQCSQRQFLLRPDARLNQAFLYCLAEAAQRYGIRLIFAVCMSNHIHLVFQDPEGRVPQFLEQFHKMFAKCVNVLRGRSGNVFAAEPPCIIELVDCAAVIAKVIYSATNPVKDGLVERVHEWPGVNTLDDLLTGRERVVHRPEFYFDPEGRMPATVTLKFALPDDLGDTAALLTSIREQVHQFEEDRLAERMKSGRQVLGRARVLRQSWRDAPKSPPPPLGALRPRVATRTKWARIEALQRCKAFQKGYRVSRLSMLAGTPIPFPRGTYWLRRFVGVPIAESILD